MNLVRSIKCHDGVAACLKMHHLTYLFLSIAHQPSSQGDGPNEARGVCEPADLPFGETEEGTGHTEFAGGEVAAARGGLFENDPMC